MVYHGILRYARKERETVKQVCCVGYYFIESAGIGSLGEELYRIKPYHRWKVADELWKNLQAV